MDIEGDECSEDGSLDLVQVASHEHDNVIQVPCALVRVRLDALAARLGPLPPVFDGLLRFLGPVITSDCQDGLAGSFAHNPIFARRGGVLRQ